jgi:RIP homotypic interaction motif
MHRMDPVTLIVTALAAGASAGAIDALTDDVKASVKASYGRLHELVRRRFRGNASAEVILAEHQADPKTYEAALAKKLAEAGAGDDIDLVGTAKAMMELLDQQGTKSGKYSVTIMGSKGVQIGDGNRQINHF